MFNSYVSVNAIRKLHNICHKEGGTLSLNKSKGMFVDAGCVSVLPNLIFADRKSYLFKRFLGLIQTCVIIIILEIGRRRLADVLCTWRYCLMTKVDRKMVENMIKSNYEYMQFFFGFFFSWLPAWLCTLVLSLLRNHVVVKVFVQLCHCF